MKLLPTRAGFMSLNGKEGEINANNLKLGKNYAVAIAKSMRHMVNTQSVIMPGNRLGRKGGEAILSSLVD